MPIIRTSPFSDLFFLLGIGLVGLLSLVSSIMMICQGKKIDWTGKRDFKLIWDIQAIGCILLAMFCLYSLLDWYWLAPKQSQLLLFRYLTH